MLLKGLSRVLCHCPSLALMCTTCDQPYYDGILLENHIHRLAGVGQGGFALCGSLVLVWLCIVVVGWSLVECTMVHLLLVCVG